jgi:ribonuclease BN (tRNA processing enzyme)
VLFDLGSGALGNLQLTIDYPRLDAVVVSHMHADHFLDLIPLRYGLTYGPLVREGRLPLWLPPGGASVLRKLCGAFEREGGRDFLDGVFAVGEYDPSAPLDVGDLRLTFRKTVHYIDAYAIRAEHGTASVTYSGDTAPCDAVVDLARDCSLFLCEATLGLGSEEGPRGHSSSADAASMASKAGAHRLALTHYAATSTPEALIEAASRAFTGPVSVVDDGMELQMSS